MFGQSLQNTATRSRIRNRCGIEGYRKGCCLIIAGFICRQLQCKLERESHEFKQELILCLVELVKHDEECGTDEEWTDLLDRGGLVHIKETSYRFFYTMECVVKENLWRLTKPSAPSKVEVIQRTTDDNDVQFYWLIVTADLEIDSFMENSGIICHCTGLFSRKWLG